MLPRRFRRLVADNERAYVMDGQQPMDNFQTSLNGGFKNNLNAAARAAITTIVSALTTL